MTAGPEQEFYRGLHALIADAFPKRCANCGRVYATAEQFLRETTAVRQGQSGLKQSTDDAEQPVVELFRNCVCGSTLMDFFDDRRDESERGTRQRARFESLLARITARGIDRDLAVAELRKALRGEVSALLRELFGTPR